MNDPEFEKELRKPELQKIIVEKIGELTSFCQRCGEPTDQIACWVDGTVVRLCPECNTFVNTALLFSAIEDKCKLGDAEFWYLGSKGRKTSYKQWRRAAKRQTEIRRDLNRALEDLLKPIDREVGDQYHPLIFVVIELPVGRRDGRI